MKIHIPEDCTQINVLVSGGVDSTILLFLLLQENAGRVPVKTFTFAPRNNLLGDVSLNTIAKILPWLEARFQTNIPHMVIKRTSYIRRAVEDISLIEDGYVYTGCNKVMYNEFTPTIYIPNDTPPVRGDAFGIIQLRPFINRDKIEIMHEFVMHDIIELLYLTK